MKALIGFYFTPGLLLVFLYIIPAALGMLHWLPNLLVILLWGGWAILLFSTIWGAVIVLMPPAMSEGFKVFCIVVVFVIIASSAMLPGFSGVVGLYTGLIEEALATEPIPLQALPAEASARSFQVTDLEVARLESTFEVCGDEDCDRFYTLSATPLGWSSALPIRHWVEIPRYSSFCQDARTVAAASPPAPSEPFVAGQGCGEGMLYTNRSLRRAAKAAVMQHCEERAYPCRIQVYLGFIGAIEHNADGSLDVIYDAWSGRPPRYHAVRDDSGTWQVTPRGLWVLLKKEVVQVFAVFAFFVWGIPGGLLWIFRRAL